MERTLVRFAPVIGIALAVGGPTAQAPTLVPAQVAGGPGAGKQDAGTAVWLDDRAPAGSRTFGPWELVERPVRSGQRSVRLNGDGLQRTGFVDAARPTTVRAGDHLFAHVFLARDSAPETVMVSWRSKERWFSAFWGSGDIPAGSADSVGARMRRGNLPQPGQWHELHVPAVAVGLEPGAPIDGVAFSSFRSEGSANTYWDLAGIRNPSETGRDGDQPQGRELRDLGPGHHVWLDETVPSSSRTFGRWEFVDRPAYSGLRSARLSGDGLQRMMFVDVPQPVTVGAGDQVFAHVFVARGSAPETLMVSLRSGDRWHSAFWGNGDIPAGSADSVGARVRRGALPRAGEWRELRFSAVAVGLEPGAKLDGLAFSSFRPEGAANTYWDLAGIFSPSLARRAPVEPVATPRGGADGGKDIADPPAAGQPGSGRDVGRPGSGDDAGRPGSGGDAGPPPSAGEQPTAGPYGELEAERDRELAKIERELDRELQKVREKYAEKRQKVLRKYQDERGKGRGNGKDNGKDNGKGNGKGKGDRGRGKGKGKGGGGSDDDD